MSKLFENANEYCRQSNWKDLAMLKFCLCAIGIVIGLFIPDTARTAVLIVALIVFVVTYIPLMKKFFKICFKK